MFNVCIFDNKNALQNILLNITTTNNLAIIQKGWFLLLSAQPLYLIIKTGCCDDLYK